MKFNKNESNWPLVVLEIAEDINDDQQFNELLKSWSELYLRSSKEKIKFKLLINLTNIGELEFKYISSITSFLKKCKTLTEMWMDRTAIIVEKNTMKSIMDFVFTVYKPVRPFKVFQNSEESIRWVLS